MAGTLQLAHLLGCRVALQGPGWLWRLIPGWGHGGSSVFCSGLGRERGGPGVPAPWVSAGFFWQHNTMESLLERGEKLDDLVSKSEVLGAQSKAFYKTVSADLSSQWRVTPHVP